MKPVSAEGDSSSPAPITYFRSINKAFALRFQISLKSLPVQFQNIIDKPYTCAGGKITAPCEALFRLAFFV